MIGNHGDGWRKPGYGSCPSELEQRQGVRRDSRTIRIMNSRTRSRADRQRFPVPGLSPAALPAVIDPCYEL